ncbi:Receptor-interacting serine/threonine-protein kinase 1 [Leucoagaricus sp. SymC.cos]|nr:Receptor-interacting serine/threonine-protein kinase 1 [Leucoagaricus sp. SymC.cos]
MENGNLSDFLKANPDAPRLPFGYDVTDGLAYLHRQSIVHGDLKGANILVTPGGSACLADFGLSSIKNLADQQRFWTQQGTISEAGGTPRWQAPELLSDEGRKDPRPTFKSDIYALGGVMYEIFTGRVPFHEIPNPFTVMLTLVRSKDVRPTRPPVTQDSELLDEIWQLMEECWDAEPEKRPAIEQVVRRIRGVYPGPFVLMRWMMWIRQWQQQQTNILHGIGLLEMTLGGRWVTRNEMDVLERFTDPIEDQGDPGYDQHYEISS